MHLVDKVFPKIEATAVSKQYGRFVISPLESGYGLTLGNALRRVLLTSLPGSAATSVRVMGVQHEFAPRFASGWRVSSPAERVCASGVRRR